MTLGVKRVPNSSKSNFRPNLVRRLTPIIETYIGDPAEIRNRIAHGQWIEALNSDNTAVNQEISRALQLLDVVQFDRWHGVATRLFSIVETLIESPTRAIFRDYWPLVQDMNDFVVESSKWTLAEKIVLLQRKEQWADKSTARHQPAINTDA